jgi:hypothetical protein
MHCTAEPSNGPSGRSASNRCNHCGGKFGLIRYPRSRRQFCSKACIEAYLVQVGAMLRDRAASLRAMGQAGADRA